MVPDDVAGAVPMSTHHLRIAHGRYKGELYTRLPLPYLRSVANSGRYDADLARAELERRGTPLPDMEISHHAIDRASTRLMPVYLRERKTPDEGLYTWLLRRAGAALRTTGAKRLDGLVEHRGITFQFEIGRTIWPVLVTVRRARLGEEG